LTKKIQDGGDMQNSIFFEDDVIFEKNLLFPP
jgi:hypothetical protein